jgi:tetratricopeptide (TPR) repeat protein
MMKTLKSQLKLLFISFSIQAIVSGCTSSPGSYLNQAQRYANQKKFEQALNLLDRNIFDTLETGDEEEAAKLALDISENSINDYAKALKYSNFLAYSARENTNQIGYLVKSSELLFDKLNRYSEAIPAIQKVLFLVNDQFIKANLRLKLIRSFYFIGEYENALSEVQLALQTKMNDAFTFQTLQIKGHIYQAQQQYEKATEVFLSLVQKYPIDSLKENIHISLALNYEESFQIQKAIEVLKSIQEVHEVPEFIKLRIARLEKKVSNSPGFRGLRK